jgi:putative ABC transport system ATP-binding protein
MKRTNRSVSNNGQEPLITLQNITRTYQGAAGPFTALHDVNLQVEMGSFVAIIGKSGSGKSTLLNILTGIDRPTTGEAWINGTGLHQMNEEKVAMWRGRTVGIIFQFFQLLPILTVAENVMLPMDFGNTYPARQRRQRALNLLEQVGILDQADKFPSALSGGQQQRVAIARALANDPPIIVADEPTGNLDTQTSTAILQLFTDLVNQGKTVVMVTHEHEISKWAHRTVTLKDGILFDAETLIVPYAAEVIHA